MLKDPNIKTFDEAQLMICPYNKEACMVNKCMFWISTSNGKKEVSRILEPYEMTPHDISNWIRRKKEEGYVNEGPEKGKWRDAYVKYEESYKGYCSHIKK